MVVAETEWHSIFFFFNILELEGKTQQELRVQVEIWMEFPTETWLEVLEHVHTGKHEPTVEQRTLETVA